MKKTVSILGLVCFLAGGLWAQEKADYKNPRLPIEQRVNDLMRRMSLEDKVNQLRMQLLFFNEYEKGRKYEVGHVRNVGHFLQSGNRPHDPASTAKAINEDSEKALKASRLGIPVIQHGEALHGAQWGNATCFTQSIAMAATFDDDFYYRVGQVVAKELRAVGVRQVYAPVINISRDSRWGRTEEGYGEDVLMNSRMGVAYTKALEEGGARSIMASYNSVDGVPSSCNSVLLNDILRKFTKIILFVITQSHRDTAVFNH